MGDVVGLRIGDHVVGDAAAAARNGDGLALEALGQAQRIGDAIALLLVQLQAAPRFDVERGPWSVQAVGEALGVAHQPGGARILADADQHALARRPWPRDGARLHLRQQLLVDAVGGAAQRQFAQRRQVGRREEVLQRALRLLRDVDLAFLEALDQVFGRQVDQLDGIGAVEDRIRHRLAHAHPRDLRDDVVQAFDVLDVDGGIDVDAAVQDLLHVEVALRMAAAGRVGVGEFVDQDDLRPAGEDGVEVHLLEPAALVLDAPARNDLETLEQRLGLLPAVGFDDADDDVVAVLLAGARRLQHFVGLADAGSGADEDAQLADAALLSPGRFQQGVGRRSPVGIVSFFRHRASIITGIFAENAPRPARSSRTQAAPIAVLCGRRARRARD